jgi:hypothetical protein
MISVKDWLKLPIEKRIELIEKFNLKRSTYTDVRGGEVFSDGFTQEDLKDVNLENNESKTPKQNEGAIDSGNGAEKESGSTKKRCKGKALSISSKK